MLVYNTTYHVSFEEAKNFVIWIHQYYIPKAMEDGSLTKPRLCKVLSHHDADSECFSLQFDVENSAILHQWYSKKGVEIQKEMEKIFKDKAIGFSTLLEIIEES